MVDNTNLINITIAQLRGRQGFRQMCSVRKISLQSSFLLKLQDRSLVILFKDIAGQRSRVKTSSTWSPCTTLWSPMVLEQTRFCSPTKQAVTSFKRNVVEEIRHECWHLYCTSDIKCQFKSSVLAKQLSQILSSQVQGRQGLGQIGQLCGRKAAEMQTN